MVVMSYSRRAMTILRKMMLQCLETAQCTNTQLSYGGGRSCPPRKRDMHPMKNWKVATFEVTPRINNLQ